MEITITNEQKVKVTLTPTTATGKPAELEDIKWEVQSGDSTVEASDDGLSATLISSDSPGLTSILITADADLGDGEVEVQELIELNVEGALAANLGLTVGTPEPK